MPAKDYAVTFHIIPLIFQVSEMSAPTSSAAPMMDMLAPTSSAKMKKKSAPMAKAMKASISMKEEKEESMEINQDEDDVAIGGEGGGEEEKKKSIESSGEEKKATSTKIDVSIKVCVKQRK
jgi:hypothetical protein